MTKGTPHPIFIADSTRRALRQPADDLVFVDELDVRGKQSRVRLWTLAERRELEPKMGAVRTGAYRE
jgi:class 3 adenylate cyclase